MSDNPSWHIFGDWFDNCSCAVPIGGRAGGFPA
jgi:hypothetical protein